MPRIMGVNTPESFANLPWYERMNPFGSFVPAEERAARADGMLQMGLGILANNQGNYGSFLPALSRGGMMGMQAYQQALQAQSGKKRQALQDRLLQSQIGENQAQAQERASRMAEMQRMLSSRQNLIAEMDKTYAPETIVEQGTAPSGTPGDITAPAMKITSPKAWEQDANLLRFAATRALGFGDKEYAKQLSDQAESLEKLNKVKDPAQVLHIGGGGNVQEDYVFDPTGKVSGKRLPADPRYVLAGSRQAVSNQNISVDTKAEQAGMVEMAKLDAKAVNDLREKRSAASMTLPILKRLEKATADGKTYSGTFAEFKTGMGRLLDSIGIKGVNIDKVSSSEQYAADIAELVRSKIKALGSGSAISNTDLLFTQRSMPELLKTPEGRMAIIRAMRADLTSVVEDADAADAYFRENRGNLGGFKSPSSKRMESGSEVDDIVKKYLGR